MTKKEGIVKISGFLISFTIIFILIMYGPAQAFTLGLTNSEDDVLNGEIINLQTFVKIEPNEIVNIDSLILKLKSIDNKNEIKCQFYVNGTIIDGCAGMSILKTESMSSQYGYDSNYGYGYNNNLSNIELNYNITVNTTSYNSGMYKTSFGAIDQGKIIFERTGANLIIRDRAQIRDCSIRAKDSIIQVGNKTFKNGRLNFYIPVRNAVNGQGYLVGQSGRERFEFNFKIIDRKIIQNNEDILSVPVVGTYKIGLGNSTKETALITFDKINKKISVYGERVTVVDMDVVFRNGHNMNNCKVESSNCKLDRTC